MKKFLNKLYIILVAFISLFGIMIFFINSSGLSNKLGNYLHVIPSYNGGDVAQDIYDTAGDDNGIGNLVYPSNSQFSTGALDLVRYTVHEPVYDAKWQQNAEYWQLVLEFMSGPAKVRNVMIYLDLDNFEWKTDNENSNSSTLYDAAENVTFAPDHAWDFAVQIAGGQGKVFAPGAEYICNTEYYELDGGKTIKIRIPLKNKDLQNVYTARKTYHYVLVGGYSEFDRGSFMPIEKRRTISHGGTKSAKEYNALIPKVYDILGDNSKLGTWNAEDFTKAQLNPVEIEMNPYFGTTGKKRTSNRNSLEVDEAFLNKVTNEYAKYAPSTQNMFEEPDAEKEKLAAKLKENPDDYTTMAYYGSCLAVLGGQSSVLQAVAYVNEAFEYLDKAVELSTGKPNEIEVLMNRANVCYSVPNEVFNKTETAAQDFMKIISIYTNNLSEEELALPQNKYAIAYCYTMASLCYKNLGKQTDSILALQEAKKLIE